MYERVCEKRRCWPPPFFPYFRKKPWGGRLNATPALRGLRKEKKVSHHFIAGLGSRSVFEHARGYSKFENMYAIKVTTLDSADNFGARMKYHSHFCFFLVSVFITDAYQGSYAVARCRRRRWLDLNPPLTWGGGITSPPRAFSITWKTRAVINVKLMVPYSTTIWCTIRTFQQNLSRTYWENGVLVTSCLENCGENSKCLSDIQCTVWRRNGNKNIKKCKIKRSTKWHSECLKMFNINHQLSTRQFLFRGKPG